MNAKLQSLVIWAKTHKLTLVLFAVVAFLLYQNYGFPVVSRNTYYSNSGMAEIAADSYAPSPSSMSYRGGGSMGKQMSGIVPPSMPSSSVDMSAADRKVVRNSDISLLVKDVRGTLDQITNHAKTVGGFMVNSSTSTPEEGGSGSISIRVPSAQLDSTLQFLRGLAVRVVSENISGSDVTDQYTDTEARLLTLTQTKATFEAMLGKATEVDEILKVQQSIFQVQDQIDSLKGQLEYLKNTSESSLVSIYLSTDELALPYSPSEPWRPAIVFKTAVRSLVMNFRAVANVAIWLGVYLPVILVVGVILWLVKRKLMK